MADRWYQLSFPHRPVFKQDLGSLIRIDGIIMGGMGLGAALLLPSADPTIDRPFIQMTEQEAMELIQHTDNPEILVAGPPKIFQRKLRYEISGHVQQKIWAADGFQCVYCHRRMGEVQLSIDHFLPLELGGVNDQTNYLSACRKCNKDKGCMSPMDWCKKKGLFYDGLVEYLQKRKV